MRNRLLISFFSVALLALGAKAQDLTGDSSSGSSLFSHSNELYSETYYRKDLAAVGTQTRLRHQLQWKETQLFLFAGVSVDRMLTPNSSLLIENSVSPQAGILYRPFSFLTAWAEYRHRIRERNRFHDQKEESDPRWGLASGYNVRSESGLVGADVYGEIGWVPRLSHTPVGSGYVRAYVGTKLGERQRADLYAEWNEYLSQDALSLGPSRHQLRAGGRWSLQFEKWNAALYAYKPWVLRKTKDSSHSEDLEALLVIGGYFP
ncbi:MAG: hypothetical protein KF789_02905 [Bdellovibrionaceae bacterium]|nr:hypothetical protein [Pseudobdellovibrionaceae bacterium]